MIRKINQELFLAYDKRQSFGGPQQLSLLSIQNIMGISLWCFFLELDSFKGSWCPNNAIDNSSCYGALLTFGLDQICVFDCLDSAFDTGSSKGDEVLLVPNITQYSVSLWFEFNFIFLHDLIP